MHITIATPMYGGQCTGVFAKSLANSVVALKEAGIDVAFIDLYNESLITRARNTLTHIFLTNKSDYLLFIDADQSFRAEDIIRMVKHDKDIIAAPVPMKGFNWENIRKAAIDGKQDLSRYSGLFNINFEPGFLQNNPTIDLAQPVEVLYAGSGMMMIKRSVFEAVADQAGEYTYDGGPMPQYNIMPKQTKIKDYWATAIVGGRLLSEDYNFCNMWRSTGGKIYVDLLAKVVHVGTYVFAGNVFDPDALGKVDEKPAEEKPKTARKKK